MKIDLEDILKKIADAVNSLRAYHMASELVIVMPGWLYVKIQDKRCDANGQPTIGFPRLFGIRVKPSPWADSVWVGKEIELPEVYE